jgi:hypothetical protein
MEMTTIHKKNAVPINAFIVMDTLDVFKLAR